VAYDLPGHGQSERVASFPPDFVERSAVDAIEVLDACHGGHAGAVIGIGFGGLVALRLAAMLPKHVNCAIADSPPGLMPGGPVEPFQMAQDRNGETPAELMTAWKRLATRLGQDDPYQRLRGTIQCPVLITFCGSSDAPDAGRVYRLARELPAQVAILPGDVPPASWNAPGFFLREVERFLAAYA
ncbi:MAG: alpha/beta hydrolase, partial [Acidobacteria bacterium]|nr:alpha/beta hydrolase [Acidobacteriota bacterium]